MNVIICLPIPYEQHWCSAKEGDEHRKIFTLQQSSFVMSWPLHSILHMPAQILVGRLSALEDLPSLSIHVSGGNWLHRIVEALCSQGTEYQFLSVFNQEV